MHSCRHALQHKAPFPLPCSCTRQGSWGAQGSLARRFLSCFPTFPCETHAQIIAFRRLFPWDTSKPGSPYATQLGKATQRQNKTEQAPACNGKELKTDTCNPVENGIKFGSSLSCTGQNQH